MHQTIKDLEVAPGSSRARSSLTTAAVSPVDAPGRTENRAPPRRPCHKNASRREDGRLRGMSLSTKNHRTHAPTPTPKVSKDPHFPESANIQAREDRLLVDGLGRGAIRILLCIGALTVEPRTDVIPHERLLPP